MPNYDETLVLIDELANLPVGWRYGEGVAIKPVFVDRIKKLVKMFELDGLERFNVFAEVDGGFILRTYFQDYFFEITYSAEDGIHVSIEDKTDVIVFEEDASPDTVSNVYQRFLVEICHLYEPSTKETMTEKSDSLSEPSSNEATMGVFQPLTSNVLHWTPYQYAPTLRNFIRSSSAIRRSTLPSRNTSQTDSSWGRA